MIKIEKAIRQDHFKIGFYTSSGKMRAAVGVDINELALLASQAGSILKAHMESKGAGLQQSAASEAGQ